MTDFRSRKDGSHYPINSGTPVYPAMEKENIEDYKGYTLKTIRRADYSFPYHVEVYDTERRQIAKTLQIETIEEANKIREKLKKELEEKVIGKEKYLNDFKKKYEEQGFNVIIHPDTNEFYDPKMTMEKDGITIKLTKQSMLNEDYPNGALKYFGVIKEVVNDNKDRNDIFYSNINSSVDYRMKGAKSAYREIVFLTVCDNLEKHGVNVHS